MTLLQILGMLDYPRNGDCYWEPVTKAPELDPSDEEIEEIREQMPDKEREREVEELKQRGHADGPTSFIP